MKSTDMCKDKVGLVMVKNKEFKPRVTVDLGQKVNPTSG